MINGKIRTKAHITGEKAIKFIQNEILPETWVSREITPDYGIDLDVELFDYENDRCITLGEHIFFTSKRNRISNIWKLYRRERYKSYKIPVRSIGIKFS